MMLSITTTHSPATDLGYLLHKAPGKLHEFNLSFGKASVFYSEAGQERCTACLIIEVDPIELSRGKGHSGSAFSLQPYVNDRPYVGSSYLSVAITQVLGSALKGVSRERPELVVTELPLTATIPVVASKGDLVQKLFEPLGYKIAAERCVLDEQFPEWGESPYVSLTLEKTGLLSDLLEHLYVLLPVLDNQKHYWVEEEEIEKLLRHGGTWLGGHPEKELIIKRYFKRQRNLIDEAIIRLAGINEQISEGISSKTKSLHEERITAAYQMLKDTGATSIADLGCGEGRLIEVLVKDRQFTSIIGMDVSVGELQKAKKRLHMEDGELKDRISLMQGSVLYRDKRLLGCDAAVLVEVIEHIDPSRLNTFAKVLFEYMHPKIVIITTPNREYNTQYVRLGDEMRHTDHRFEWTRDEFKEWSVSICKTYGYQVLIKSVGAEDSEVGAPSQMALFTL